MIDGNYFSVDTGKIIKALHALPWVEKVRLRRQWPDTLMINIEEHQPIARWGEEKWLTTTGKLVSLPLPANIVLPQLSGPITQVDRVWPKYQKWAALFARYGIRLRSMNLSRQHLYTLNLEYTTRRDNLVKGFSMILSESNSDQQLNAFLESRRLALIEYPGLIKTVDLRYPSGFSISRYELEKLANNDE
jgi:cell division protein FtsQ